MGLKLFPFFEFLGRSVCALHYFTLALYLFVIIRIRKSAFTAMRLASLFLLQLALIYLPIHIEENWLLALGAITFVLLHGLAQFEVNRMGEFRLD